MIFDSIYTWAATAVCITGTVINIWRNNTCFYFWIAGEIMWSAFDIHQRLYSRLALDALGLALAIVGAWKNPTKTKTKTERNIKCSRK